MIVTEYFQSYLAALEHCMRQNRCPQVALSVLNPREPHSRYQFQVRTLWATS